MRRMGSALRMEEIGFEGGENGSSHYFLLAKIKEEGTKHFLLKVGSDAIRAEQVLMGMQEEGEGRERARDRINQLRFMKDSVTGVEDRDLGLVDAEVGFFIRSKNNWKKINDE